MEIDKVVDCAIEGVQREDIAAFGRRQKPGGKVEAVRLTANDPLAMRETVGQVGVGGHVPLTSRSTRSAVRRELMHTIGTPPPGTVPAPTKYRRSSAALL